MSAAMLVPVPDTLYNEVWNIRIWFSFRFNFRYNISENKKALICFQKGLSYKKRHRPTLPPVTAIPSALAG
ncbi:hypothetical protein ACR78Q_20065, partial [Sphingobacterium spiritivorum]|uniref:hypothetical protein n=1 Tax=Sphingobacterium spiritivorum TaxID=258 RepID=UPI003DA1D2B4